MTRRILIPFAAVAVTLSAASVASAQGAETVPVPVTSVVERDVTVNSVDNQQVDNDDDESDKTGLWGLLGLLGLAGLAGLKRRNDNTGGYNTPVTGAAPRRSDGATGTGH